MTFFGWTVPSTVNRPRHTEERSRENSIIFNDYRGIRIFWRDSTVMTKAVKRKSRLGHKENWLIALIQTRGLYYAVFTGWYSKLGPAFCPSPSGISIIRMACSFRDSIMPIAVFKLPGLPLNVV